jgi:hypothetical protein
MVNVPAAPPNPAMFEGVIKDVRGTDGTLTLTLKDGKQVQDRQILITEARVKGPGGFEMKVGDLRRGDRVQLVMNADGRMVRVIRVLPAPKAK